MIILPSAWSANCVTGASTEYETGVSVGTSVAVDTGVLLGAGVMVAEGRVAEGMVAGTDRHPLNKNAGRTQTRINLAVFFILSSFSFWRLYRNSLILFATYGQNQTYSTSFVQATP
jgi:hypothetical protein